VPISEQQGMFIAYASAPGQPPNRGDKSGPYAAALAAELAKPGIDHLSLFQNVKEAVYAASAGTQQPWQWVAETDLSLWSGTAIAAARPDGSGAPK